MALFDNATARLETEHEQYRQRAEQQIEAMAAEVACLQARVDEAARVIRPLAGAWEFQKRYTQESADLSNRYFWKPNSNTEDIPGISFADGQAAAAWLARQENGGE